MQRALEALLRVGVLGDHHQAAGAPVQPVDGVIVGALTRLIVIIQEKITQRIVKMPRARMAGDAGGLVEHQKVRILVHDVQRPGGRHDAAAAHIVGYTDREQLPRRRPPVRMDPHAVQQDTVLQPFDVPDERTGEPQAAAQQGIHCFAGLFRRYGQRQTAGRVFRHGTASFPGNPWDTV